MGGSRLVWLLVVLLAAAAISTLAWPQGRRRVERPAPPKLDGAAVPVAPGVAGVAGVATAPDVSVAPADPAVTAPPAPVPARADAAPGASVAADDARVLAELESAAAVPPASSSAGSSALPSAPPAFAPALASGLALDDPSVMGRLLGGEEDVPSVRRPRQRDEQAAADAAAAAASGAGGAVGSASAVGELVEIPDDPAFPADRLMPARVLRRPDGTLLVDDRFVLRGRGTSDDPYLVPWALLVSAQETYKPRLGQKRLPQRVTMLNGRHVELDGYVAFPITSSNPRELLVMLNQWDGCCIGTPPTAYDAVEVRLTQPASPGDRAAVHGRIRGRFKVDPFEDAGWLLGLYLVDEGALKADH